MKFLVLLVAVLAVGVSDLAAKIFAKKSAHKFLVFFFFFSRLDRQCNSSC